MQFLPSSSRVDSDVWMHYLDVNKTAGEESRRRLHKNPGSNCGVQLWGEIVGCNCGSNCRVLPPAQAGGNTPQNTNYPATYLPSRKLFKLDEPDIQDTTGEAETSS